MKTNYENMCIDYFNETGKQRVKLILDFEESKPKLLKAVSILTKFLPINYDKKTILLRSFMNENNELLIDGDKDGFHSYSLKFKNLYVKSLSLVKEETLNVMILNLIDGFLEKYRGSKKKKQNMRFKGEIIEYKFPENIFDDISSAIDTVLSDKLYEIYGLDKKAGVIKSIKNNIKSLKIKSFNTFESELSQQIQRIPQKILELNQHKIAFLQGLDFKGLKIVVPNTNIQLIEVGLLLNNCVGNGQYADRINNKKCFVIFLKSSNVEYCIELDKKFNIIQFKTYNNENVANAVFDELADLIKKTKPKSNIFINMLSLFK